MIVDRSRKEKMKSIAGDHSILHALLSFISLIRSIFFNLYFKCLLKYKFIDFTIFLLDCFVDRTVSGKLPPVRVRDSFRVGEQFSSGAIVVDDILRKKKAAKRSS